MQEVPIVPETGTHAGPQVIFMPIASQKKTLDDYRHKQSIGLGIAQMIIGVCCVIFNTVSLSLSFSERTNEMGIIGHGFWVGILIIITGAFGIAAGKKKTKCKIIAFMVLCIISASCCIFLLMFGIIGSVVTDVSVKRYTYYCSQNHRDEHDNLTYMYHDAHVPCGHTQGTLIILAMHGLLATAGVIEAIMAIWGSVLGCRSGTCCNSNQTLIVSPVSYFPNSGQIQCINQTELGMLGIMPQGPSNKGSDVSKKSGFDNDHGDRDKSASPHFASQGLPRKQPGISEDTHCLITYE